MKEHPIKAVLLSSIVTIICLLPANISAQLVCSGAGCSELPLTQAQLDQIHFDLSYQVAKPLVDNYAKAAAAANLMTPYVGTTNLQSFTIGGQIATGAHNAEAKDISIPNVGTMQDVSIYAANGFPTIFAGVNLGYLLGNAYDPYEDEEKDKVPPLYSLTRFDVYLLGLKYTYSKDTEEEGQIIGRARYSTRNKGIQVRYQLMYGKDWLGPVLRWQGVSIMAGMIDSHTSIDYSDTQADSQTLALDSGNNMIWQGNFAVAKVSSDIKTYPVEIQTGMQILYFLNITLGGGMAWHHGNTTLMITKSGQAYLDSDLLAAYNVDTSSFLGYTIQEYGAPPARMAFAKLGLEINAAFIKIGIQGMASQDDNYGASVSLRMEF